jgi:hypothetical protein
MVRPLQKRCILEAGMKIAPVSVVGTQTWANGRARVENGEIVLERGRAKRYEFRKPEDSERMAFDLAALVLHARDEREAVSFVGRYGLLWHGWEDLKESGECRESLDDWWREAGRLYFASALYVNLWRSKHDKSAKEVQNFLRQYGYGFRGLASDDKDFDNNYITEASHVLEVLVNDGLNAGPNGEPGAPKRRQRARWALETIGPGEFRLTYYTPDLLSRAYSAFSTLIAGNVETRFCRVCRKQFRPKTQRSEACDDHLGTLRSWRSRGDPRAESTWG